MATPRRRRPIARPPRAPSPAFSGHRGATRSPARGAAVRDLRVTFCSPAAARARAPRAPTLTPTPAGAGTRPGGARHAPQNVGAAHPKRAAQILLLVAAPSCAEQPPGATSGAQSDPRSRLGGPAGSSPWGQSGSALGDSCGGAGGTASGPARGCGRLRAFRLIVPGCGRQRGRRKGWRPQRRGQAEAPDPRAEPAPRPAPQVSAPPPPTSGPSRSATPCILLPPGAWTHLAGGLLAGKLHSPRWPAAGQSWRSARRGTPWRLAELSSGRE